MTRHLFPLLLSALLLTACGSRGGQKVNVEPTDTLPAPVPTQSEAPRRVDDGDARASAQNRNAAGFQTAEARRAVSVTQPCFGTATPDRLDLLPPTPDEAARRDTALIAELNQGTVYLLRPGDRGQVEAVEKSKLLVRFQSGTLWVWRSDVAFAR